MPESDRRQESDPAKEARGAAARMDNIRDPLRSTDSFPFRRRVWEIFEESEKPLVPQSFKEIERMVDDQYEEAVERLKAGKLDGGIEMPSVQECVDTLGVICDYKLTDYVLKGEKPLFVITSPKLFADYRDAINMNRRPHQGRTRVSRMARRRLSGIPVRNVGIGFVEGAPTPDGDPHLVWKKLSDQKKLFLESLPDGVTLTDPDVYALLQLDGMRKGEIVDTVTWSPLANNCGDQMILGGAWHSDWVVFDENMPKTRGSTLARWRWEALAVRL
ncbi:hypothetical protein HY463_01165 [Candidatus Peregrinibacteria bacterium]|nr:hypothetical protein [Candidatus Peregrinibacteria bacterium]